MNENFRQVNLADFLFQYNLKLHKKQLKQTETSVV